MWTRNQNVNNLCLPISGATKCGRNTTNVDNICELNSHINACEGNKQLFKQLKNRVNKDIQNIISLLKSPDVLRLMEFSCLRWSWATFHSKNCRNYQN